MVIWLEVTVDDLLPGLQVDVGCQTQTEYSFSGYVLGANFIGVQSQYTQIRVVLCVHNSAKTAHWKFWEM